MGWIKTAADQQQELNALVGELGGPEQAMALVRALQESEKRNAHTAINWGKVARLALLMSQLGMATLTTSPAEAKGTGHVAPAKQTQSDDRTDEWHVDWSSAESVLANIPGVTMTGGVTWADTIEWFMSKSLMKSLRDSDTLLDGNDQGKKAAIIESASANLLRVIKTGPLGRTRDDAYLASNITKRVNGAYKEFVDNFNKFQEGRISVRDVQKDKTRTPEEKSKSQKSRMDKAFEEFEKF